VEPGAGKSRDHFKGLDHPPPVQAHEAGTHYALRSERLGSISEGSSIYYRGLEVGTVTDDKLAADGSGFDIDIFVRKPYDRLVNGATRFWDASAVDVDLGSNGLSARLTSLEALTAGAIAFETPSSGAAKGAAGPHQRYKLYKGRTEAELAPAGPGVSYVLHFDGAVGDLSVGAPVQLMGFSIGEVTHISLRYDRRKGTLDMPVTVELDPSRVGLEGSGRPSGESPAARMNDMMGHLIANGLRAKMTKNPPLVGGEIVSLEFEKNPAPATLRISGKVAEIPTTSSDDISSLAKSASDVVTEIKNLPLAQIGQDIRQAADRIKAIANAPQVMQSIDHLDKTLAHLEKETGAIQGQVGPMVEAMRKAAEDARQAVASANAILGGRGRQEGNIPAALRDLSDAARSIRALADYLDRNPGALLRGRTGEQR
jgi:paraquat-inducible protein B